MSLLQWKLAGLLEYRLNFCQITLILQSVPKFEGTFVKNRGQNDIRDATLHCTSAQCSAAQNYQINSWYRSAVWLYTGTLSWYLYYDISKVLGMRHYFFNFWFLPFTTGPTNYNSMIGDGHGIDCFDSMELCSLCNDNMTYEIGRTQVFRFYIDNYDG
jgi:hypothetical protein